MEVAENDKLTIILRVKQGPHETTYYVANIPDWYWYEILGIFTLYCIVSVSILYVGLWIASRYKILTGR